MCSMLVVRVVSNVPSMLVRKLCLAVEHVCVGCPQEFPRAGSRSTPVHPAADFVWKDYAPAAFRWGLQYAGSLHGTLAWAELL